MKKCKYAKDCAYYHELSQTCANRGGDYCGKYREYEQQNTNKRRDKSASTAIGQ